MFQVTPNAITYGFYNRAVLEAKWPSTNVLQAEKSWTKLRHALRAVALLKKGRKEGLRRRKTRTLSQYSHESSADFIVSSQTNLAAARQTQLDSVSVGELVDWLVDLWAECACGARHRSGVTLRTCLAPQGYPILRWSRVISGLF